MTEKEAFIIIIIIMFFILAPPFKAYWSRDAPTV